MSVMENPAGGGDGGVSRCLAGRLDAPEHSHSRRAMQFQLGADECVQAIRVELSERRRERGDCVPVASCSLATVESASSPICVLARKLVALGIDPDTRMSIWRGRTKCFHDLPVSRWAKLAVKEGQSGPVFAPYVPFSGIPVASQGAESDG